MTDCELLRKIAYSWAGATCRELWEKVGRSDVWDEAQQLRSIADKLEKLETQPSSFAWTSVMIPPGYKITGLLLHQVYDIVEQAILRGLEEGEAVPFTAQHANESNFDYTIPAGLIEKNDPKWVLDALDMNGTGAMSICRTGKDIEFDENGMQSVVTAIGGIPVVVPQEDVVTCPQGHHLKEGNCMRDFCFCQCAKCKADCGEK